MSCVLLSSDSCHNEPGATGGCGAGEPSGRTVGKGLWYYKGTARRTLSQMRSSSPEWSLRRSSCILLSRRCAEPLAGETQAGKALQPGEGSAHGVAPAYRWWFTPLGQPRDTSASAFCRAPHVRSGGSTAMTCVEEMGGWAVLERNTDRFTRQSKEKEDRGFTGKKWP